MSFKIIVNPHYASLDSFIRQIPEIFAEKGELLYSGRNKIKVFEKNGIKINVKKFRIPIFINRIAYTFFRKTKASKAYYNSLEVIRRGFDTPESIAYMEEYRNGLLCQSYYISLQNPYTREMRELYFGPLSGNENLVAAFANYTAALHECGICHLDYSPGNILIGKDHEKYLFSLVDINRMKFMPINLDAGCKNFRRMFENDDIYTFLAKEYASARHLNIEECTNRILYYNHLSLQRDSRKKRLKAFRKQIFH